MSTESIIKPADICKELTIEQLDSATRQGFVRATKDELGAASWRVIRGFRITAVGEVVAL